MDNKSYRKIIKYAYDLTGEYYAFSFSTKYLENSVIASIDINDEKTYKELAEWQKGIRQDYMKILVAMNAVEKIQQQRRENTFEPTYNTSADLQATNEIGCWIDYIFTRYRSILDYIYQVVFLCVPPQLSGEEKEEYDKLRKQHSKCKFLLKTIAKKVDSEHSNLLDMNVFKQIVDDRDYLVHDCASCTVFSDCRDSNMTLTFKVWTKNSLEEDETEITNPFYCLENNIIDYRKYWGLQLSILIVFFETIFIYLKNLCTISPISLDFINNNCKTTTLGVGAQACLPHIQDALRNILKELI